MAEIEFKTLSVAILNLRLIDEIQKCIYMISRRRNKNFIAVVSVLDRKYLKAGNGKSS